MDYISQNMLSYDAITQILKSQLQIAHICSLSRWHVAVPSAGCSPVISTQAGMLLGPLPCGMYLVAGPRKNVDECTVALEGYSLAMKHVTAPPLLWSRVTWPQLHVRSRQGSAFVPRAIDRSTVSVSKPEDTHVGTPVCLASPWMLDSFQFFCKCDDYQV